MTRLTYIPPQILTEEIFSSGILLYSDGYHNAEMEEGDEI